MINISTGSDVWRKIINRQQYIYKSELRFLNENLLTRNTRARIYTQHLFGCSQEIITNSNICSLLSRLILRRRLIRIYTVCSQEFLSKIKK